MFWLDFLRQWLRSSRATRHNLAEWEGHSVLIYISIFIYIHIFSDNAWYAPKFHPHFAFDNAQSPQASGLDSQRWRLSLCYRLWGSRLAASTHNCAYGESVNGWWTLNSRYYQNRVTVSWPSQDKKVIFETEDHKPQSEKDSKAKQLSQALQQPYNHLSHLVPLEQLEERNPIPISNACNCVTQEDSEETHVVNTALTLWQFSWNKWHKQSKWER